jgi:hypothetical protein
MKKNSIRLTKLEAVLIKGEPEIFELSHNELLERLKMLMFKEGKKPTQKFLDKKKVASRTRPTFTLKQCQRLRAEEAEWQAKKEAMSDQELDDLLCKARRKSGEDEEFEDMSDQEIKDYNKTKKETLC